VISAAGDVVVDGMRRAGLCRKPVFLRLAAGRHHPDRSKRSKQTIDIRSEFCGGLFSVSGAGVTPKIKTGTTQALYQHLPQKNGKIRESKRREPRLNQNGPTGLCVAGPFESQSRKGQKIGRTSISNRNRNGDSKHAAFAINGARGSLRNQQSIRTIQ